MYFSIYTSLHLSCFSPFSGRAITVQALEGTFCHTDLPDAQSPKTQHSLLLGLLRSGSITLSKVSVVHRLPVRDVIDQTGSDKVRVLLVAECVRVEAELGESATYFLHGG